ncbi:MAG: hypothetical protein ACXABI_14215 [Candidatus Hodarchaeales archaeon]|jgi:hypothetical protein
MTVFNVGRIIFGAFYLISAGFNLLHTINNTEYLWIVCLENVRFPLQKEFLERLIIPNETIIILLIVALEIVMGVLILTQGTYVKIGLILGILWVLFVSQFLPINDIVGHLILGGIQALLLLETYDETVFEVVNGVVKK